MWSHIKSVGQINSYTWVAFSKQISYLIYCFGSRESAETCPMPLTLLSLICRCSCLLSLSSYFSDAFVLPHPISLFFFCSCCLSFTDGMTCGNGGYAKHSWNKCRAENSIKKHTDNNTFWRQKSTFRMLLFYKQQYINMHTQMSSIIILKAAGCPVINGQWSVIKRNCSPSKISNGHWWHDFFTLMHDLVMQYTIQLMPPIQ